MWSDFRKKPPDSNPDLPEPDPKSGATLTGTFSSISSGSSIRPCSN